MAATIGSKSFRDIDMGEGTLDNYGAALKKIAVKALGDYYGGDFWNGSKFFGSLGPVSDWTFVDYWKLRKRSANLFRTNLYAKGVIRRLVWNEVHTGIVATPTPVGAILFPQLGEVEREALAVQYGDKIATQFDLYANTPAVFDWSKKESFGAFQERVRMESLISGDGIIISRIDQNTNLPRWQWVNGDHIRTPDVYSLRDGHYIKHGVEFDRWGKKVAFYVRSQIGEEYSFERIPVRGEKSGRLISWMVYGSEHFVDDVRGEPLLSDSIYMLKDLDRTRDAEVRAALVNAMIPLFLEEAPNEIKAYGPADLARSMGGGAVPAQGAAGGVTGAPLPPSPDGALPANYGPILNPPTNQIDIMNPGTVYKTPAGGKIQSFQTNRPNVNYSTFEKSVIAVLAWSKGIPPEVLMLEFGNNYSASRQANNEFEIYLGRFVKKFAGDVTQPIYNSWLTQMALTGQIDLPGFVRSYGMADAWRIVSAWQQCSWTGLNRPSVDRLKEANASEKLLDNGLTTYDLEARRHSGMSFLQVMQTQKRERELMARMDFVPHTLENNNGEPAYNFGAEEEENE